MLIRRLALAAVFAALAGGAAAERFTFVALGDMPYGDPPEVYGTYEALIGEVNRRGPDLVIHVGDTKSGSSPCTDQLLDEQLAYLMTFDAPLIYTPGDNEWTDCHRSGFDPLERLAYIRAHYFADPATSFGRRPVVLEHQGARGYPENVRLILNGVAFIGAHVVGSNNNFDERKLAALAEFSARDAASSEWLAESFDRAAGADAIVVAIHADMLGDGFRAGTEEWSPRSGHGGFGRALQRAAAAFGKPVLLVFGDSHEFKVFRPFPKTAPNVTAVEVFGGREMHAVAMTVDTGAAEPFAIAPLKNPALP